MRVKCTTRISRTLNRIGRMLSVACLDDDTDVAGVSAFNNPEKVGRIHLYRQFSGESLPEN